LAGVVPDEKIQGDCSITHREGVPQLLFVITDEPPLTRDMGGRNLKRVFFTLREIAKALTDDGFIVTIAAHEYCGYNDWSQLTQDMIPIADLRADTFHGRFDARDTFLIEGAKGDGHDLGAMGRVVEETVATELTKVVAGVAAEAQEEVLLLTGSKPSSSSMADDISGTVGDAVRKAVAGTGYKVRRIETKVSPPTVIAL